jgi:hypothetical protein
VTQILSYSRAEGTQKLPVIVAPVMEETCELIRGSSPETLQVKYQGDAENVAVMGDPTRLHQLFMNLCSNAVQAMAGSGLLEVAVATERIEMPRKVRTGEIQPGEYVRISVKDSGHGIAPEVIDRIFEPFFTTKPAGKGTGLGLALVHAVVTEHQGFIDVESKLGGGTTFTRLAAARGGCSRLGRSIQRARAPGPRRGGIGGGRRARGPRRARGDARHARLRARGLPRQPRGARRVPRQSHALRGAGERRGDAGLTGTQLAIELRKIEPGAADPHRERLRRLGLRDPGAVRGREPRAEEALPYERDRRGPGSFLRKPEFRLPRQRAG